MVSDWNRIVKQPLSGVLALWLIASIVGAADPSWYSKSETWRETAFNSRVALEKALAVDHDAQSLEGLKLGTWRATKPLPAAEGFDTVLPPEEGVLPTSKSPEAKKLWQLKKDWRDGTSITITPGGNRSTYAFRTLTADREMTVPIWLDVDDRVGVWLNGRHIFSSEGYRGINQRQDKVELALRKGDNDLMLKLFDKGGAYAFSFSLSPRKSKAAVDETAQLWSLLGRDFTDAQSTREMAWERDDKVWNFQWNEKQVSRLAGKYAALVAEPQRDGMKKRAAKVSTTADIAPIREAYIAAKHAADIGARLALVDMAALRRGVEDLAQTFPDEYAKGKQHLRQLTQYEKSFDAITAGVEAANAKAIAQAAELLAFQRETLLANPLLDFDKVLVVKRRFGGSARSVIGKQIGAPNLNSHTNSDIPHRGWDNEITVLSDLRGDVKHTTLYRPEESHIVRDLEVDFDASRVMFSSIGGNDAWALFEVNADGSGLRQITPIDLPDVDFFDSCYMPDGRVATCSTAGYQGLPCEGGGRPMVNLYQLDPSNGAISQLTFEQDSDYHPAVLNNGRLLYLRWEYSDIMHYFSRILFSCNPDGTNQAEFYGSGSFFPTAYKHARAIPGHPSMVIGIISGHHATPETGRLALVDPALGRKYPLRYRPTSIEWGEPGDRIEILGDVLPAEETGFVQEIPGYGKDVVGNVLDGQGTGVYPNFVYPYPLSEKYHLVTMKPDPKGLWGLYLVDVFDNMTLIVEEEGAGYFEPFPFVERARPPVIPDRITPGVKTANVYITDIYSGPGLAGIPRGSVKSLRVFAYHFAYNKTGGHAVVGVESSWDVKRILGTTPVEEDGSANFIIPANTPVSLQPLDEEGRALQLMRSWLVGKPGELVSCVGCHEMQSQATANTKTTAFVRKPTPLEPWHGEARPFAFGFEVQPVLEKRCMGCHDGEPRKDGKRRLSFADAQTAYKNLHPFVRRPGPESDMSLMQPMEYHASTSPLMQMFEKGHYGVELDREDRERFYCWIDLNAPYRGSWEPKEWRGNDQIARRLELAKLYADVDDNPEAVYAALAEAFAIREPNEFIKPERAPRAKPDGLSVAGFPFSAEQARAMQTRDGVVTREIKLDNNKSIRMVRVPAGSFIMGSESGYGDEAPRSVVQVEQAFWMSECEITNGQYEAFDPGHDTRYYDEHGKDLATPGYIGNHADQPVARVSWNEAKAFCAWFSESTGLDADLPSEAQWEWAARAGSDGDFHYGDQNADFSKFANLSDNTRLFTRTKWDGGSKVHVRRAYDEKHHFPLRDDRSNDAAMVTNYVGKYAPNPWGLKDMVGNVNEWTRSDYAPYPFTNNSTANTRKVARGGSWHDRPRTATATVRTPYEAHQKVFNVGFRIILKGNGEAPGANQTANAKPL